ncbi:MAG: hypothetical protein NTU53_01945 [Planctomycetota bacterium]|nr:hypothetical protein [Planctomycetota bacterium]
MIPQFDENGQLPPGIHRATLDEVVARFGHGSEEREAQGQSLAWLIPMCRRAGVLRLILNGSFVTSRAEPMDVDCLLVPTSDADPDSDAFLAIRIGLPYLSIQIVADERELSYYVDRLFATDRTGRAKGLVEVIL